MLPEKTQKTRNSTSTSTSTSTKDSNTSYHLLLEAAEKGDLEYLKSCPVSQVGMVQDSLGRSVIHAAVVANQLRVVQWYVARGFPLHHRTCSDNANILHTAVLLHKDLIILQCLCSAPNLPIMRFLGERTCTGSTPLQLALEANCPLTAHYIWSLRKQAQVQNVSNVHLWIDVQSALRFQGYGYRIVQDIVQDMLEGPAEKSDEKADEKRAERVADTMQCVTNHLQCTPATIKEEVKMLGDIFETNWRGAEITKALAIRIMCYDESVDFFRRYEKVHYLECFNSLKSWVLEEMEYVAVALLQFLLDRHCFTTNEIDDFWLHSWTPSLTLTAEKRKALLKNTWIPVPLDIACGVKSKSVKHTVRDLLSDDRLESLREQLNRHAALCQGNESHDPYGCFLQCQSENTKRNLKDAINARDKAMLNLLLQHKTHIPFHTFIDGIIDEDDVQFLFGSGKLLELMEIGYDVLHALWNRWVLEHGWAKNGAEPSKKLFLDVFRYVISTDSSSTRRWPSSVFQYALDRCDSLPLSILNEVEVEVDFFQHFTHILQGATFVERAIEFLCENQYENVLRCCARERSALHCLLPVLVRHDARLTPTLLPDVLRIYDHVLGDGWTDVSTIFEAVRCRKWHLLGVDGVLTKYASHFQAGQTYKQHEKYLDDDVTEVVNQGNRCVLSVALQTKPVPPGGQVFEHIKSAQNFGSLLAFEVGFRGNTELQIYCTTLLRGSPITFIDAYLRGILGASSDGDSAARLKLFLSVFHDQSNLAVWQQIDTLRYLAAENRMDLLEVAMRNGKIVKEAYWQTWFFESNKFGECASNCQCVKNWRVWQRICLENKVDYLREHWKKLWDKCTRTKTCQATSQHVVLPYVSSWTHQDAWQLITFNWLDVFTSLIDTPCSRDGRIDWIPVGREMEIFSILLTHYGWCSPVANLILSYTARP